MIIDDRRLKIQLRRRVDDLTKQLSDANDTIRLIDSNAQIFANHCRKNGHEYTAQWIEHYIIRRNPSLGV
jgi:hypothetical protein